MPVASLQKLVMNTSSNNSETSRIDFLAKHIYAGDYDRIDNMNKALKLGDSAMRTITAIKFYANWMNKTGRLPWENYKEKLEQAQTISTALWF